MATDPDRYSVSFSVQARESAPSEAPADAQGGELVDSGAFRIDASRLIERLRDWQFADPHDFILPLMRCAVASEATRLELWRRLGGLEIRFDGLPFPARRLKDPLQALLDGDAVEALRGRQLAFGLLALERLGMSAVCVTSGGPSGQASWALATSGVAARDIGINRSEGTVIRILWSGLSSWWDGRRAIRRLRDAYGLSSTALSIDGRRIDPCPVLALEGWHGFDEAGWRGAFRFLAKDGKSRVRFYWLGTFIELVERDLKGAPVEAVLAGDDLSLDLSQAQLLRDRALEDGLAALASQVARRYGPTTERGWYDP